MHTMPNDNNVWTSISISVVNVGVCNPDAEVEDPPIDPKTGSPENEWFGKLNIYPNPVTDAVTIVGLEGGELITFFNLAGQLVLQSIAVGDMVNISISALPKGLYLVNITKGKAEKTVKLIVN
jgi:hypothetical protein